MNAYAGFYRLIDTHGVLHLATGSMRPGTVYCGFPPEGNRLHDEAASMYPPNTPTRSYLRVCTTCQARLGLSPSGRVF